MGIKLLFPVAMDPSPVASSERFRHGYMDYVRTYMTGAMAWLEPRAASLGRDRWERADASVDGYVQLRMYVATDGWIVGRGGCECVCE